MERLTERIDNVPDGESGVWVKQHDYISAAEKLADYEDAEEQGLLLRLPCKVGDTVWVVTSPFNVFDGIEYDENMKDEVYEAFISSVTFYECGEQYRIYAKATITLSERILENAILGKPYSLQKRKPKPS